MQFDSVEIDVQVKETGGFTEEEKQMAITASKLSGSGVHGVDIVRDSKVNNKPFIFEVNGRPGLSGDEAITGGNVAGAIIQYVLDKNN